MVLKPEPLFEAVEAVRTPGARVILMTPQGRRFDQARARRLARESHLVFVCGHYEGVDERVRAALATEELSIGDYVLTNGALPAAVVIDAVVRLRPGVLGGGAEATSAESFTENALEYPHYTRPPEFRGMRVPDVLLGGNHGEVAAWRRERSRQRTARRRPDLLPAGAGAGAAAKRSKS
jgi:tRNA (guanine37-N1)-methyltransferase